MGYRVVFSPEAQGNLVEIFEYIVHEASPAVAHRFTSAIVDHCEGLELFPLRGTPRDDIRPGLRVVGFRRRVTIALTVGSDEVRIIGVFYGGRDFEGRLQDDK